MSTKNSQLLKVEDVDGLYKDPETQSVVNLNHKEYELHKKNKQIAKKRLQEEHNRIARLNNLEREMAELKKGIGKILELLKNAS